MAHASMIQENCMNNVILVLWCGNKRYDLQSSGVYAFSNTNMNEECMDKINKQQAHSSSTERTKLEREPFAEQCLIFVLKFQSAYTAQGYF